MNQQTALGAYLDPIADKLLVITSFIMLGLIGGIPEWLAVVVVSRDILILIGYGMFYFLVDERPPVQPSIIGKCSTLLQLVTLGAALALLHDESILDRRLWHLLVAATAITTIASGLQYLYRGLLWLQHRAPKITRLG